MSDAYGSDIRNAWRRNSEGIHGQSAPIDSMAKRKADQNGRCIAQAHASGVRCKNKALVGQTTCKFHGGATAAARAKGKKRKQYDDARKFLARLGVPITEDPRAVLLKQVYAANGMMIATQIAVQELTTNDLEDPTEDTQFKLRLYAEWTDRAAKVSQMATSIGLEERMVRLAETQGKAIVAVVKAVIFGLHLNPSDSAKAYQIAAEQLRSLAPQFAIVEGSSEEVARPLKRLYAEGPITSTSAPAQLPDGR